MDLAARSALAATMLEDQEGPARVTAAFFSRHPECDARFGPTGRRRCTEDARLHLSFLAGAVQAGSATLFADYARWCGAMLSARGIDRGHLIENLELLAEEVSCEGAASELLVSMVAAARAALAEDAQGSTEAEPPGELEPLRLRYLAAALAGRRAEAWEAIAEARRQDVPVATVYRDVLRWGQGRLGELWSAATITVAQEHMASAVTQSVMARLYADIPGERTAGRALIAGVEGELHALPAQLASDLLELEGWDVAFVGTHLPVAALLAAIEAERPDVLGLSTTIAFNLPRTVAAVRAVRERFGTLPIVLGGRAVRNLSELAVELAVEIDTTGEALAFRAIAAGRRP